jgi:hypothetical protein
MEHRPQVRYHNGRGFVPSEQKPAFQGCDCEHPEYETRAYDVRHDDECCVSIGKCCRPKNWVCSIITWLVVFTALGLGIAAMIQINALDDHRLAMHKISGTECGSPSTFVNGFSDELFTLYNACTDAINLPGMATDTTLPVSSSAICYGIAIGDHHCVASSLTPP